MTELSVNHPWTSLRGAAIELLLLEWHARHRWCPSCAEKHALAALGLAEEAVSLAGGAEPYPELAARAATVAELAEMRRGRFVIMCESRPLRRTILGLRARLAQPQRREQ